MAEHDKLLDVILLEIQNNRRDVQNLSSKLSNLELKVYTMAAILSVVGGEIKTAIMAVFFNKQ